jgi:hypothetical protein
MKACWRIQRNALAQPKLDVEMDNEVQFLSREAMVFRQHAVDLVDNPLVAGSPVGCRRCGVRSHPSPGVAVSFDQVLYLGHPTERRGSGE